MSVFVTRPISAVFVAMCAILIATQLYVRLRSAKKGPGASPQIPDEPMAGQMAPQRIPVSPAE